MLDYFRIMDKTPGSPPTLSPALTMDMTEKWSLNIEIEMR